MWMSFELLKSQTLPCNDYVRQHVADIDPSQFLGDVTDGRERKLASIDAIASNQNRKLRKPKYRRGKSDMEAWVATVKVTTFTFARFLARFQLNCRFLEEEERRARAQKLLEKLRPKQPGVEDAPILDCKSDQKLYFLTGTPMLYSFVLRRTHKPLIIIFYTCSRSGRRYLKLYDWSIHVHLQY